MNYNTWVEFRGNKNSSELTNVIVKGLRDLEVMGPLSQETVAFLCSYNNIRKDGDEAAHEATQIELQNSVETKKDTEDGLKLAELYRFCYPDIN